MTEIPELTPDTESYIAHELSHDLREGQGERIRWNNRAMGMMLNAYVAERAEVARLKAELAERAARNIECEECGRHFTPTPKVSVCCECVAGLKAELAQAQRERDEVEAAAGEYRSLLQSLRWSGLKIEKPTHYSACPVCKMRGPSFGDPDHTDSCEYQRVMRSDAGRAAVERLRAAEDCAERFCGLADCNVSIGTEGWYAVRAYRKAKGQP